MTFKQRLIAFATAATLCVLASASALAEPSAIYVVRHGEKQAEGKDPALTAQGRQRAQNIATLLRKAGIDAVFSSATLRTQQTAQPTAQGAGVDVRTYDASKPEALVAEVKARKGGAVLVVGHSNTVPALVTLLGGAPDTPIADDEFDRVYLLVPVGGGRVQTVQLTSTAAAPGAVVAGQAGNP